MAKWKIGFIGTGHRSAFYIRVAKMLPDLFEVCCAMDINAERVKLFAETWGIQGFTSAEEMFNSCKPDFVVAAVVPEIAGTCIRECVKAGVPVLSETPPALSLADLIELNDMVKHGAKIQVAEQYNFIPLYASILEVIRSGRIGDVSHAQVGLAHLHHGYSLLRNILGLGFENAKVTAFRFEEPILDGPTRFGTYVPKERNIHPSTHTMAMLEFEGKSGVFEFVDNESYNSWIRMPHVRVFGSTGEITDSTVRMLKDQATPVTMDIKRMETVWYDYMLLYGLTLGDEWIYKNKYQPVARGASFTTFYGRSVDFSSPNFRLSDGEIAIADVLVGMGEYASGGPEIYSLAEASQDQYMVLCMEESVATGKPVMMTTQSWAR